MEHNNMFTQALEKEHERPENSDLDVNHLGDDIELDDNLDYKTLAEQEAKADEDADANAFHGAGDTAKVKSAENGPGSGTSPSLISLPVPPDGGWGWIVCAASFLIMIVLDGLLFSFGVFYMELIDYFRQGKGQTALVGSTLMGTHLIFGPVTSVLVNLWDCRRVAMVGTLVATVAFVVSIFAPNIPTLIFTYGFLGGIGVSMIYIPAILIVGFYFEKKRAIANGISNSGSGLGAFIYAPLSHFLLSHYGWRGALLLLAGLVLNCLVCSALFRPLRPKRVNTNVIQYNWADVDTETLMMLQKETTYKVPAPQPTVSRSTGDLPFRFLLHSAPSVSLSSSSAHQPTNSPYTMQAAPAPRRTNTPDLGSNSVTSVTMSMPYIQKEVSPRMPKQFLNVRTDSHKSIFQSGESLSKPLYRKDIFYTGSINKLPEYQSNPASLDFTASMLRIPNRENEEDRKGPYGCHNIQDTLRSLVGISLLKSPIFLLIIVSSCMWTTHSSVLTILPEHAVHCGVAKHEASFLVSMIGIANIAGRMFAGVLVDRFGVDVLLLDAIARMSGGLVNVAIIFTSHYYLFLAEAAVFGTCMGVWVSLRPIALVELLGLEKLTNAFGLLAMFQGVAFCIGPPVAGVLFDATGSYTLPFIMAATAFTTSGILCLPMRKLVRWEVRQKNPLRACCGCEAAEADHTMSQEIDPASMSALSSDGE